MVAKMVAFPGRIGSLVRTAAGVSALAITGQLTMVAAIPVLTRLYSPDDFGIFTIYLSIVNILGSIAALRFGSSLYIVADRLHARVAIKLALFAVCATTCIVLAAGYLLSGLAPEQLRHIAYLVPVGMIGVGFADVLNCWCLRFDHIREFGRGRLILPASMALLQVGFGLVHLGGNAMIAAHILSQAVLIAYLGSRVLRWDDVRGIAQAPWQAVVSTARREYKFPLFELPSALAGFAIINLPAILIGSLFGTAFAGQFGVAARLVTGPVSLIALPLSNVFVPEASKSHGPQHLLRTAHGLLLVAAGLIVVPVLALGLVAPYLVVPILGQSWMPAGQIMTALAFMGAAQALSTPVQEVPTLLRRQELRLVVDLARALLVFAPLLIGAHLGWNPLEVIYFMAAGGTIGFTLGIVAALLLLNGEAASERTRNNRTATLTDAFEGAPSELSLPIVKNRRGRA
ncbi:lipopolysaccharide biosynthesis protein [Bradyrhizobium lablabi]|uniref:lipopolysaccharide biosynthesis protein n=1 Tax=Bradyrhizobium lablabi TaxID=722472 RepID=UPI001BAB7256|nr:lipopolysaccharide biosynthesis protein [Bradyrhizobium lablabi]MBR0695053.1 lipopolysaccharide biosynthesis protein [Bradyrhizobium lablabi]